MPKNNNSNNASKPASQVNNNALVQQSHHLLFINFVPTDNGRLVEERKKNKKRKEHSKPLYQVTHFTLEQLNKENRENTANQPILKKQKSEPETTVDNTCDNPPVTKYEERTFELCETLAIAKILEEENIRYWYSSDEELLASEIENSNSDEENDTSSNCSTTSIPFSMVPIIKLPDVPMLPHINTLPQILNSSSNFSLPSITRETAKINCSSTLDVENCNSRKENNISSNYSSQSHALFSSPPAPRLFNDFNLYNNNLWHSCYDLISPIHPSPLKPLCYFPLQSLKSPSHSS